MTITILLITLFCWLVASILAFLLLKFLQKPDKITKRLLDQIARHKDKLYKYRLYDTEDGKFIKGKLLPENIAIHNNENYKAMGIKKIWLKDPSFIISEN